MEPSAARGRAITQAEEETVQIIEDRVYAFSKDNPPCYTAQPGEVLQFNTLDCFSGRLTDETVTMKDMDFSYNITNPAAGPVYVEGAEVGAVLVVDIYDIQVADEGTIATDDHCGPLFEGTDYRTKKIKIEGGMADFNGVRFPINPMIGVIGTAPTEGAPADGASLLPRARPRRAAADGRRARHHGRRRAVRHRHRDRRADHRPRERAEELRAALAGTGDLRPGG